jgi:hypothetical protein
MKYSVIKSERGISSFFYNQDPVPDNSGIDGMRQYLFWQNTLKIVQIRPEDYDGLNEYISQTPNYGNNGVPVPFEIIEIYKFTDGKNYARRNKSIMWDSEKGEIIGAKKECFCCKAMYEDKDVEKNAQFMPICKDCGDSLIEMIIKYRTNKTI